MELYGAIEGFVECFVDGRAIIDNLGDRFGRAPLPLACGVPFSAMLILLLYFIPERLVDCLLYAADAALGDQASRL
jgi:hypothetical protein